MAMIEEQPAQRIAVLARTAAGILARALLRGAARAAAGRRVALAGGTATLLIVLLLGLTSLRLWITTSYSFLLIPGALGVPLLLPGLRFTPLPDQSWTALGCEDFAALVLVGTVYLQLARHRRLYTGSGRLHRFFVGWGALLLGGLLSGFFRGLVVAREVAGGPLSYFGYPVLGALFAVGWCLTLGWIPGFAAVFAVVPTVAVDRAREWWVESGRLVLLYLVEPTGALLRRLRGSLAGTRLPRAGLTRARLTAGVRRTSARLTSTRLTSTRLTGIRLPTLPGTRRDQAQDENHKASDTAAP